MTRTVLMDYDGTLHDWDAVFKRSLDNVLGLNGEEFFKIWTYKIHRGQIHKYYLDHHDDIIFHCKLLFKHLNIPFDEDSTNIIIKKMKQLRVQAKKNPIYFSDAFKTLDRLKKMGFQTCLSTGIDAEEKARNLENYIGRKYFDQIFSEEILGFLKTEPDYYLKALKILKTEPNNTVSVGDTPLSDIRPAKLLGIKTIWLNRRGEPLPEDTEQVADHIVKNLTDVIQYL